MSYKVKVKKISIVNEAGDRVVLLTCYLVDTTGNAIKAVDGSITFDVRVPKSAPIPNPVPTNYLPDLAKTQIAIKYNRYLTTTKTPTHSSNKILFASSDVEKLFTGLTVSGPGISTTATLNSITTPTEIQLSSNLTLQITGTTTSPSLILTGTTIATISLTGTTTLSSSIITMANTSGIAVGMSVTGAYIPSNAIVTSITPNVSIAINQTALGAGSTSLTFNKDATIIDMANTTGIVVGMFVSGSYIPSGSVVLAINPNTSITINQKATGSGTVSLTFTTVANSIYLNSSTSYFTSTIYEGLSISGPSTIPRNTTIYQVISATQVQLSNNATGTATGTSTISGDFTYYFDTVNLTLDTSELSNISDLIINFENL